MYQYIYDHFLNDKKYDKILNKIEAKLIDLGIKGKVHRISLLKNMENFVRDIINKESDCLVIVGNDQSVAKILNIVASKDIVFGIIPVGNKNIIADFFGIPQGENACRVLSARKIEKIDLGLAGGQYFLSSVEIFSNDALVVCDNKFEIKALNKTERIGIYNLCLKGGTKNIFNPQDGLLELISIPQPQKNFKLFGAKTPPLKQSFIKIKKAKILSSTKTSSVLIDSQKVIKTPIEVTLAEKKLKVIVGKERKF